MTKLEQLVERLRALGYEARAVASTERSYGPAADYAKLQKNSLARF